MGIDIETDEALLTRVRDDGDIEAFGRVYERHAAAARRFARSLCDNEADADDLTADVFTGLLASLRSGNGPTQLALPYLFASIKHGHWRTTGQRAHQTALTSKSEVDAVCVANDIVEAEVLRTALSTLPDGVQTLLWRAEVDDECLHEAAERDSTSAHNVAVLRHRARRALGTAYLAQHAEPDGGLADLDPECQASLPHLASLVRDKVGTRRRRRLEQHLAVCPDCSRTRQRLEHLNARLRVAPRLPWNVWSAGLTTTIKTQVTGWLGTSAVTLAGPTVLAVAILVPAPAMMERTDDPESTAVATATAIEPHSRTGFVTDDGWAGRPERPDALIEQQGDAGAASWVAVPSPSPSPAPSSEIEPRTSESSASAPSLQTATTSEPLSPVEVSPDASHRDDAAGDVATPAPALAAVLSVERIAIGQPALEPDPDPDDQGSGRDDDDDGHGASGGASGGGAKELEARDDSGQRTANGSGQSSGHGKGLSNGNGNGQGNGNGNANGESNGNGQGQAKGQGQRAEDSDGDSDGDGDEQAIELGPDEATGQEAASGWGNGHSRSDGQGNGNGNGNGNGDANGHGNGRANGHAKKVASVPPADDDGALGDEVAALDAEVAVTEPELIL